MLPGTDPFEPHVLDVKFREGTRIRVLDNRPVDIDGSALKSSEASAALDSLAGSTWSRLHTSSEDALEKLRITGRHPNGKPLPDLNLWYRLLLDKTLARDQVARVLSALADVEGVSRVSRLNPECFDAPDFSGPSVSEPDRAFQKYLYEPPAGINAAAAWTRWGVTGAGVQICDVEFGFDPAMRHHDLGDVTVVGGAPILPDGHTDNHGTAVMAVYGGTHNGKGVRGIAHGATKLFAAGRTMVDGVARNNIVDAITRATVAASRGDIILLEVGEFGPRWSADAEDPSDGVVPLTWNRAAYDAVVTAVANGIIVVEAAGNGSEDLDDPIFRSDPPGHRPFLSAGDPLARDDSGSIMVGACEGNGNIAAWANTNHGNRVNLFSWGFSIVTALGSKRPVPEAIAVIHDPFPVTGDRQSGFARNFGGTSGASAIVAGAAALVQEYHKRYHGRPLASDEMRWLLWYTGIESAPGKLIGKQPDVAAAIEKLASFYENEVPAPIVTPAIATATETTTGMPTIEVRLDFPPGDSGVGEIHYGFTPDIGSGGTPFNAADPAARILIHHSCTLYARIFRHAGGDNRWTRGPAASGTYIVATTAGTGCRTAAVYLLGVAAAGVGALAALAAWIL